MLPNVFPELLHCTLNGSALVIKNTFIDVESNNCGVPCRVRAKSAPPAVAYVQPTPGATLLALRQRLLTWDCVSNQSDDYRFHNCTPPRDVVASNSNLHSLRERQTSEESSRPQSGNSVSCTSSPASVASSVSGETQFAPLCEDSRNTTVIMKDLPDDYTREQLLETLGTQEVVTHINFLYLPIDFGKGTNFGYALINFVTSEDAQCFITDFQCFCDWSVASLKVAHVEWSGERQGVDGLIERYRNSAMMHKSVVDEAKPIVLQDGVRTSFPAPTKAVKPLRVRAWKFKQARCLDLAEIASDSSSTDVSDNKR